MTATMTGIISNVGHICAMEASRTGVKVAPTARPRMVRIPSFRGLIPLILTPDSAAIRQAAIGPSSQGRGRAAI